MCLKKCSRSIYMKGAFSIGLAAADGSILASSGTTPMLDDSATNIFDLFLGENISFVEGSANEI